MNSSEKASETAMAYILARLKKLTARNTKIRGNLKHLNTAA